jgi:hypothetical protein
MKNMIIAKCIIRIPAAFGMGKTEEEAEQPSANLYNITKRKEGENKGAIT